LLYTGNSYQVHVLGIFVEGSAYAEAREVRLRLRYAAQMAFASQDFKPADRNHLGNVSLFWPKRDELKGADASVLKPKIELVGFNSKSLQAGGDKRLPINIPFEWFVKDGESGDGAGRQAVLVLWLKEEDFADYPLVRLVRLQEALTNQVISQNKPPSTKARLALDRPVPLQQALTQQVIYQYGSAPKKTRRNSPCRRAHAKMSVASVPKNTQKTTVDLKIIGPRSLDMLERMDNDLNRISSEEIRNLLERSKDPMLHSFSPFQSFLLDVKNNCFWRKWIQEAGDKRGPASSEEQKNELKLRGVSSTEDRGKVPVILVEDTLSEQLKNELKRRGVNPIEDRSKVAVVFEGDTLYGRTCSKTFCNKCGWGAVDHVYLRGLDGIPSRRIEDESKSKENRESDKSGASEDGQPSSATKGQPAEYPVGDRQFDYARRMAASLEDRCAGEPLEAIGIFGSDVSDKLILLQALRKQFPGDTYFFTTDLDARYLDPGVLPDTRNLLIASTYPLDPSKVKAGQDEELVARINRIPPFRDSNQTAVFFACLKALGSRVNDPPKPKLYEVGRKSFIELPDTTAINTFNAKKPLVWVLLVFTIAGLFCWERFFPIGIRGREKSCAIEVLETSRNWRVLIVIIFGLITIGGISYYAISYTVNNDSEPFRLLEGVSTWPTEIIRLAAVFLSVIFLIFAWYKHRICRLKLWSEFLAQEGGEDVAATELETFLSKKKEELRWKENKEKKSTNHWEKLRWFFRTRSIQYPFLEKDLSVEELLKCYLTNGLLSHRCLRVIGWLLAYTLVVIVLYKCRILSSASPSARGILALRFDTVMLVSCTISFWFLAFYVLDATRMALHMIKRLGGSHSNWPRPYMKNFCRKRLMDPDDLEGYADVKFVAFYTKEASCIVVYPFIVLAVMIVARSQFFDRWSWPVSVIIFLALVILFIVLCSFSIRRAARGVKEDALKELDSLRLKSIASDGPLSWRHQIFHNANYTALIERAYEDIKSEADGAYAPWFLDRAAGAFLIPSAGTLIVKVFEYLFSAGY
jgi:uncharacterized integral membrane protein